MSGADRIHPADLWANTWRWVDAATLAAAQRISYGPDIRGRPDQRVLKIMKRGDVNAASGASALWPWDWRMVRPHRQPVIFGAPSAAFFEALAKALVPMDVYAKRAASRILLQYASLARGDQSVSESGLRRISCSLSLRLSVCSPAPLRSSLRVKHACALDSYEPVNYDESGFWALRSGSACAGAPAYRISQGELVRIGRRRHGAPEGVRGSAWLGG